MTFKIDLSEQAKRFLKRQTEDVADRLMTKLEEIARDPFRYLEHYEGDSGKVRIGKSRALAGVMDGKLKVRVLDKRGRIYKR